MRQKRPHSSDTSGATVPTAPARGRAGALLTVLLAVACAALVFQYAELLLSPWTSMVVSDQLRVGFAVDSALLVLALAIVLGSRGGVRGAKKPPRVAPSADTQDEQLDRLDEVHADVRVLQAQIHSLEEALAQQEDSRAPEPEAETRPEPEPVAANESAIRDEVTREVLHRVRCTVRGLGVRNEGDPVAADILARVEAAVDRLAATGLFERPTLSEPDHTLPLPQGVAVPQAVETTPLARTTPRAETAAAPPPAPVPAPPAAHMPLEVPDDESVESPVAPAAVAADEPEVVLPVPPSPPAPQAHRGRRWRRRSTAA